MQNFKTDARINTLANAVYKCNTVLDIGTDHGKLPAKLLIEGACKGALLVDISAESLRKSKELFDENKLVGTFIVSDGLDGVNQDFDCVVISGMGSDLISNILIRGESKLKGAKLVLGPNLKEERLREFLSGFGYTIESELLVEVDGRIYNIIVATRGWQKTSEKVQLIGKIFNSHNDKDIIYKYLQKKKKLLLQEYNGKSLANIKHAVIMDKLMQKIAWIDSELERLNI